MTEADKVNCSPAADGKYKWMCDICGATWEEEASLTDFTNTAGDFITRDMLPSWGVYCDKCSKKK